MQKQTKTIAKQTKLKNARQRKKKRVKMLTKAKIKHLPSVALLAELREIFRLVDRDNSGTITGDELQMLLETIGINVSKEEIKLMFHVIDNNGDGEISFDGKCECHHVTRR